MRRVPPLSAGLLLGAAAGVLAVLLSSTALVRSFEAAPFDVLARAFADAERARSSRVRVALLTDGDLRFWQEQGMGELARYPLPRQVWGEVISGLAARGAGALVVDLILTTPSPYGVEDDRFLAGALAPPARAVLPLSMKPSRDGQEAPAALPDKATVAVYGAAERLTRGAAPALPIERLIEPAARLGNAFIEPDGDGVIRRVALAMRAGETCVPSLPLAAAMVAYGESSMNVAAAGRWLDGFGGSDVPLDGAGSLLLNYRGARGSFPTVGIAELAAAQAGAGDPCPWLEGLKKDDVVVLGVNIEGNPDVHATPTDESLPGPEIVATALDNLMRGDALARPPTVLLDLIAFLLAALVGAGATLFQRMRAVVIAFLLLAGAFLGLAVLLFWLGWVLDVVTPLLGAFLACLAASLYLYQTEGRKRREIRRSMCQYLSADLVAELEDRPELLRLGGDRRELTVLFSDIAGFTSVSEKMDPQELVAFLNEYLTVMTDVILDAQGTIDKYEGDAIMAFWGAPLERADHARLALQAAARCQEVLRTFSAAQEARGRPPLHTRIGLNTGPMVVGNMGSTRKFDYTVIGDAVNLASRLEGANKFFGSSIMVSQETLDAAGMGAAVTRPLGRIRVKGKEKPVRIHELLGAGDAGLDVLPDWAETFARGMALFEQGDFAAAAELFARADQERPGGDPVAQELLKLSGQYARRRPRDFDGVITLTEK